MDEGDPQNQKRLKFLEFFSNMVMMNYDDDDGVDVDVDDNYD